MGEGISFTGPTSVGERYRRPEEELGVAGKLVFLTDRYWSNKKL